jgi:hypothetical protein
LVKQWKNVYKISSTQKSEQRDKMAMTKNKTMKPENTFMFYEKDGHIEE